MVSRQAQGRKLVGLCVCDGYGTVEVVSTVGSFVWLTVRHVGARKTDVDEFGSRQLGFCEVRVRKCPY